MTTRFHARRIFGAICFLFLAANAFSQSSTSADPSSVPAYRKMRLFAGLAIPIGAFASNDIFSPTSGYALPGGIVGAEYDHELAEHYGFAVSAFAQFHGSDLKSWKKLIPFWTYLADPRLEYSAAVGPFFDSRLSEHVVLYGSPQIGITHGNYPNITISDPFGTTVDIKSGWVTTVSYHVNAGVVWKKYDFGVRFAYADPQFTPTYKYYRQTTDFLPEDKPMTMIALTLGLAF
jgi:hypothetical protein